MTNSAFRLRVVASNVIAKSPSRAVLHLATVNGVRVAEPVLREANQPESQGRMDRQLAMYLASTDRLPDEMFYDNDSWY